jgi:hypothetical protein
MAVERYLDGGGHFYSSYDHLLYIFVALALGGAMAPEPAISLTTSQQAADHAFGACDINPALC